MHPQVETLAADPEVKDLLAMNYMRFEQRDEHTRDIEEVETVLNDPARRKDVQNPGKLRQQVELRKRNLARQTPPSLTGSQKDKLARLEQATFAAYTEHMPTQEQMRHQPPGAVDHHEAWEKQNKRAVILWKRARLLLNPESRERDLCNIEKYRPSGMTRSLMTDAQINRPQPVSASREGRENYDQIDWTSSEVAADIQRLIDQGKIKVNLKARRGLRVQKDGGKVYECTKPECPEAGRIFSGGWAKAHYNRHMESHQLVGAGGTA